MATTDFGSLTDGAKRVWSSEVWKAGRDQSFWFANGFIAGSSSDMNKPVQRVTELSATERGLECVMQLVLDMQSDGIVGDNKLSDNEESLINDVQTIRIDQLRNAVKSHGELAEQASVIRFRAQAKEKLTFWISDKVDELCFLTGAGRAYSLKTDGSTRTNSQLPSLNFAGDVVASSANRLVYPNAVTGESTMTTTDTFNWGLIVKAKARAKRKKIRPIREGGKEYFCILMSSEQERDLLNDATYQTIVRSAAERGSKNPLFTNSVAVVQGVILYSHNKVFNTLGLASGSKWGSGGTVDGAQAMLLGAQALGLATVGNVFMRESDVTDYGNQPGIGFGRKLGLLKPQWKSIPDNLSREDFGVLTIKTAAAA